MLEAIASAVVSLGHEISFVLTMFDDGKPIAPTVDALPRRTSFLSRLPLSRRLRRWMLPLYPRAVEELSQVLAKEHVKAPIDLVISTSSAAIKGLRTPLGVPHLCYCHTPARYLWSQPEQYSHGAAGPLRGLGLRLLGPRLRAWDRATAAHVTHFIANSTHTQGMIRECYSRDSTVIFPPVRTDFFTPPANPEAPRKGWLYAGALEPYKRVDLAIHAALIAKRRLDIVGDGSQYAALRAMVRRLSATSLVRFTGRLSDDELRERYRGASVLLFPQIEDFGIVAVEAQACGTPVAAIAAGGARDTVIPTGACAFATRQDPKLLAEAALECERLWTYPNGASAPPGPGVSTTCRNNAERFSEARFQKQIIAQINQALASREE